MKDTSELRALLAEIVGQAQPNRWGYDAACVALDDNWRARARAALAADPHLAVARVATPAPVASHRRDPDDPETGINPSGDV